MRGGKKAAEAVIFLLRFDILAVCVRRTAMLFHGGQNRQLNFLFDIHFVLGI